MSIDIRCIKCLKTLDEQGGLLFSPPKFNRVKKFHICVECWKTLIDSLTNKIEAKNES